MSEKIDMLKDLELIRSMMERSTRFFSLSGWVGILIGTYSLVAAGIAYWGLDFHPDQVIDMSLILKDPSDVYGPLLSLGVILILLTVVTVGYYSRKKATINEGQLWTPITRIWLLNLFIPLVAGGFILLILLYHGLTGLLAPFSLIFYGLALINASKFSYTELRILGIVELILGILASLFIPKGLIFWAIGFGLIHILYGIYMYLKYEK